MSDSKSTEENPTLINPSFREKLAEEVFMIYGGAWGNALGTADRLLQLFDQELERRINEDQELAASKYWVSKTAYKELYKLQQLSNYVEWTNPKLRRVIATRMAILNNQTKDKS